MLRPSHLNPTMSAYKALHGPYDWDHFPLATPGCTAVIYKAPETQGLWASHGTNTWYVGPSLNHYRCNHYFIPETCAYRISGLAELFPQHCQVPFLLWNGHLQEVIDELVTTLGEMPPSKRAPVMVLVKQTLMAPSPPKDKRILTNPNHEWIIPPGDLQRTPYIPPVIKWAEHRASDIETQRMAPTVPTPTAIQRITNTPPIMAASNPTMKRQLKLTKHTHVRRTQNNIPGSVPLITNIMRRSGDLHPIPTCATATHWSPRTHTRSAQLAPTCIPCVRFSPIPSGLRSCPIVSQEAINFLTKCVWAQSSDIFTLDKLRPATSPSCLNFKQLAMPMVHPTSGETISSYKKLMHDPATTGTWQTAFGKDFGGMAQGDNKTGQKATNSIFVMSHDKIKKIPTNQTVTYARVVVNF
jgi:hypothetical protein